MCYYARMFVTHKKEAKYPNLMTSTSEEKEPKKKAYAKMKSIMCNLFHTRGKNEHAPAV